MKNHVKFLLSLAVLVTVISACGIFSSDDNAEDDDRKTGPVKVEKKDKDNKADEVIIYGTPVTLPDSNYFMIPVGFSSSDEGILKRITESISDYTKSSDGRYNMFNIPGLHNVIIHNKLTGQSNILLANKRLINKFYYPQQNSDSTGFLLFTITNFPKDEKDNSFSGETVFISDIYGTKQTQISPEGVELISWIPDYKNDLIFMTIKEDMDKNKKFEVKDKVKILKTSISSPTIGNDVITDSVRTQIDNIFKKQ